MANFITISSKKISNSEQFENISHEMNRRLEYMDAKERKNIDPSKSHLNKKLLENKYKSYQEFLDIKKQEIKRENETNGTKYRMITKDAASQYNFIIQASKEALTFKQHQEFLCECAYTLHEYFKDNEIIEAHIHNDETTPHLHFCLSFFNKKRKKFNQKELLEEEKTKIDSIFQGFNLLGRTSALENVELPLVYRKIPAKKRKELALEALLTVGLQSVSHHTPSELSGGQQQRVAIARAIVSKPLVLLADEPTGNLDSIKSLEIMNLLKSFNKELNITIIMVTHEEEMAAFAHRIIYFRDGHIDDSLKKGFK